MSHFMVNRKIENRVARFIIYQPEYGSKDYWCYSLVYSELRIATALRDKLSALEKINKLPIEKYIKWNRIYERNIAEYVDYQPVETTSIFHWKIDILNPGTHEEAIEREVIVFESVEIQSYAAKKRRGY